MAGTKAGAAKARETNKEKYGDNYYAEIAKGSWKNPERSRLTGFALLETEEHKALSQKGGLKKKTDYKTTESPETNQERTGASE